MKARSLYLGAECLALFGLLPFAMYYLMITPAQEMPLDLDGFEPRRMLFPLLWLAAIAAIISWKRTHRPAKLFARMDWVFFRRKVLPRFALSTLGMIGIVLLLDSSQLFSFPRERTLVWAIVVILYPLISVVPQEVLFRLFFFERYAPIFGQNMLMIAVSGLAFGHAHLIFNNAVAYVMSIVGGVMFSMTYAKTRNLSLVWLEHAIYGQVVFTVGLGWYFFTGAALSHG